MANHDPSNPLATPLFDEWGWGEYWDMNDWLAWHTALKEAYGQPAGNDAWVNAWNSRSGFFRTFGDVRGDWVAFNTTFRNHLQNHKTSTGITMLEAIQNPVGAIMGTGTETVGSVGESLGNVGTTLTNTTKTISWLLPVALVAAIAVAVFLLIKINPNKLLLS